MLRSFFSPKPVLDWMSAKLAPCLNRLMIISTTMMGAPIPLAFTLTGVAIWLVVVLVLSALASILPARSAARLTIREVLAYE